MDIKEYFKNINDFTGSVNPYAWNCIEAVHSYQEKNGINGPIGEIGVHHGKFYVGLSLLKGAEKEHLAIDIFDMQLFNIDKSGNGDYQIFLANCEKYGLQNPDINKFDSLHIPESFITKRENKYSLFSVDACHTPEHTISDFKTAIRLTANNGVILIDDYYNPLWPGVQEGITKFYLNEYCNYIPFLYTCNKLFVCSYSYHDIYIKHAQKFMRNNFPKSRVKMVKRFGYDTLTVVPNQQQKYVTFT